VLEALKKFDGAPAPPSQSTLLPPVVPAEPENEVLAALAKFAPPRNENPRPIPPPMQETATPKPPEPVPTSVRPPTVTPAEHEVGFSKDRVGAAHSGLAANESEDDSDRSVSVTGHRHKSHRRPPPRRRKFTKRNVIMFGTMFVICLTVAGFMAVMNFYASQIDVDEFKKSAEEAVTKQATEQILKQLKEKRR